MTECPRTVPETPAAIPLLIVSSTLHIGGAERVAACLGEHLDRRRFDVTACYLKDRGVIGDAMLASGVRLVPVPGLVPGRIDRLTFWKLRRLIVRTGVRVIHTHDMHGLIDGALCRAVAPRLRHVHTFHFGNYPHRSRTNRLFERLLWRIPDALVAVGHSQAESIHDLYGIPRSLLNVIWNGIEDPQVPGPGARCSDAGNSPPTIASISTLIPQKGIDHLLEAAALLHDSGEPFRLVLAGDGALRNHLVEKSTRLGLSGVIQFLGWVQDAPRQLLPTCDVFVQSSLWEAMSVVILEAMAAGKAIVATRVGDNGRVLADGESGLLVSPGDPAELAGKLRAVLRDPDLRSRLGAAARRRFLERFTVGHMVRAYEDLYSRVLAA